MMQLRDIWLKSRALARRVFGRFGLLVKEKQLVPQDARHGGVMRLLARDGPNEIKTPDAEKR